MIGQWVFHRTFLIGWLHVVADTLTRGAHSSFQIGLRLPWNRDREANTAVNRPGIYGSALLARMNIRFFKSRNIVVRAPCSQYMFCCQCCYYVGFVRFCRIFEVLAWHWHARFCRIFEFFVGFLVIFGDFLNIWW